MNSLHKWYKHSCLNMRKEMSNCPLHSWARHDHWSTNSPTIASIQYYWYLFPVSVVAHGYIYVQNDVNNILPSLFVTDTIAPRA